MSNKVIFNLDELFISVGIDVGADFSWMSIALPNQQFVGKPYKILHNSKSFVFRSIHKPYFLSFFPCSRFGALCVCGVGGRRAWLPHDYLPPHRGVRYTTIRSIGPAHPFWRTARDCTRPRSCAPCARP